MATELEVILKARDEATDKIEFLKYGVLNLAGAFGIATSATAIISSAFNKMNELIDDSIKNFMEDEHSVLMLEGAIKGQGKAIADTLPYLESYTKLIFNTTRFTNEDARAVETLALGFGYEGKAIKDLLVASSNLAVMKGMTLPDAAQLLIMSIETSGNTIGRTGLKAEGLAGSLDRAKNVFNEVNTVFKDAAQTDLTSFEGKLININKQIKENEEAFGKNLIGFKVWISELKLGFSKLLVYPSVTSELDRINTRIKYLKGNLNLSEGFGGFFNKLILPTTALKKTIDEIIKLEAEKKKIEDGMVDVAVPEANKTNTETEEEMQKRLKDLTKEMNDQYKATVKYWDDEEKATNAGIKALDDQRKKDNESLQAWDRNYVTTRNSIHQANERFLAMERNLSEQLGMAMASGIGKGAAGLKEALKEIMVVILGFVEKKILAYMFATTAEAIATWNPVLIAKGAAVVAGFEAAKMGIMNFQTFPGQTRTVPGPYGMPMNAIVHGGEQIGRSISNSTTNNASHIYVIQDKSGNITKDLMDSARSKSFNVKRFLEFGGIKT
jgi:RNase H-fold protein (predicted Holliday junction resolvase)